MSSAGERGRHLFLVSTQRCAPLLPASSFLSFTSRRRSLDRSCSALKIATVIFVRAARGDEADGKAFNRKVRKGTSAKSAKRSLKVRLINVDLFDALHTRAAPDSTSIGSARDGLFSVTGKLEICISQACRLASLHRVAVFPKGSPGQNRHPLFRYLGSGKIERSSCSMQKMWA